METKRKCKFCEKEFILSFPTRLYCSNKCKRRTYYLKGNEYTPHPRLQKLFYVNCSYCGNRIRKLPSDLKHSKSGKLYCNKSCKAKFETPKRKIECFCYVCGKKMLRTINHFLRTKNVFCSRKCFGKYLSRFIGERALAWRGGYSKSERTRIRGRKPWKELRELILFNYSYLCAHCGKGGILHLHHIIPYRLGGKDTVENLIPLCPKCHSKQTVKDREKEFNSSWKQCGAHIYKGGDANDGEMFFQKG